MKFSLDSKGIKLILIIVCLVLLIISYGQRRTRKQYQEAAKLPFYNTSLDIIPDGTYLGKTYASFLHVQLAVTVQDHVITDIQILENVGSVGKNVAPIVQTMVELNKTAVPAIKGEELASLAFISCADDALYQAVKPKEEPSTTNEN